MKITNDTLLAIHAITVDGKVLSSNPRIVSYEKIVTLEGIVTGYSGYQYGKFCLFPSEILATLEQAKAFVELAKAIQAEINLNLVSGPDNVIEAIRAKLSLN